MENRVEVKKKGRARYKFPSLRIFLFPRKRAELKKKEKLIARASLRWGQNGQNLYLNKISTNE